MARGLVAADDLTGACDAGHGFAKRGFLTRVRLNPEVDNREVDVLVVNTDSRYDPEGVAGNRVRRAIESNPFDVLYKKIDSTLRGNLVSEIDATIRAVIQQSKGSDPVVAMVAPASPANGRTTVCGIHLVHGHRLTDTEVARDSEKGPSSSHVPTLLSASEFDIDTIGIETVAGGPEEITPLLDARTDHQILVCDATHDIHLEAIATASQNANIRPIFVGSAGLAEHVSIPSRPGAKSTEDPRKAEKGARGVLAVVGSTAPQTLSSLQNISSADRFIIDPAWLLSNADEAITETVDSIVRQLSTNQRAVLSAAMESAAVERTIELAETHGLSEKETKDRIADTLGEVTLGIIEEAKPRGLVLTGGDTAMAVLSALETDSILLSGDAIEAGIPIGTIEGGRMHGSEVVTKAGGFGNEHTIATCLDRLGPG